MQKKTYTLLLPIIVSLSYIQLIASEHSLSIPHHNQNNSLHFLFSSTLHNEHIKKTEQLLEQGADPNIQQYCNNSLLHSIIEKSEDRNATIELTQLLCKSNANVNAKNYSKETPLTLAIKKEDEMLVELLLKQGAETNIENGHGDYPIHMAMEWDTEPENRLHKKRKILPRIVQLLLQYGANPNIEYHFKRARPLHAAVFHNSPTIVQVLLMHGANKNMCDERGLTPLALAQQYQYKEIIHILSQNTSKSLLSHRYTPPAWITIDEEIASFHIINIEKTPFNINTDQPFSSKIIIDDYLPTPT